MKSYLEDSYVPADPVKEKKVLLKGGETCPACGQRKPTASEVKMGNQNARKNPLRHVRSKDNMEGVKEGKQIFRDAFIDWLETQEVYVYKPEIEKFLKRL